MRCTWCWEDARRPTRSGQGPRRRKSRRCSGPATPRPATRGSRPWGCRRLEASWWCAAPCSARAAAAPGSTELSPRLPNCRPQREGCWTSPVSTSTSACSTRRSTSISSMHTRSSASCAQSSRRRSPRSPRQRGCAPSSIRTNRSVRSGRTGSSSSSMSWKRRRRSPARTSDSRRSGGCWRRRRSCGLARRKRRPFSRRPTRPKPPRGWKRWPPSILR